MSYLIERNGHYYFYRRVPAEIAHYDSRKFVRVSLKTDSKAIAMQRSALMNQEIEKYWDGLVQNNKQHETKRFQHVMKIARLMGFRYAPAYQVADLPLDELVHRVQVAKYQEQNQPVIEAVLGGVDVSQENSITINEALEKFWSYSHDRIMNKSEDQKRKWRNPRKKAIKNFVKVVGNKALSELSRDDITLFRDWWIVQVEAGKSANSANKDLINVKNVIETVNDHLQLSLQVDWIFRKLTLKERFQQARKPLETDYIRDVLLNPHNLKGLNPEGYWFLHAMTETGARVSELLGLFPEDICLDDPVAHIKIVDRKSRPLKTVYSQRDIPLVGCALEAFKAMPNGFERYRDRPDAFSGMLNKYLREHDLLPSKQHTVYSLRHSFQDRLLSVNAPDRVQAELMGHKFQRPSYGDGASLEQKRDWLERILIQRPQKQN